jgi:hypothetical protein
MRLAVAAISCGLASFLAACSGGPSAPAGETDAASPSSGGPFAPVAASGPFAPVAASGPFAPVVDPGPFGPVGPTWVDEQCPAVCALAERVGCPIINCPTVCAAVLAEVPEACQAAYSAYIECLSVNGTCGQDGEIQATACNESAAAVAVCVRPAQPNGPPNGPPDAAPYGGI